MNKKKQLVSQYQKLELEKQAHDNAIEAGKKLIYANEMVEKAEAIMQEANIRLSNSRKFEAILNERQKKLDRAFVLLNRERAAIKQRQIKAEQHEMLLEQNIPHY